MGFQSPTVERWPLFCCVCVLRLADLESSERLEGKSLDDQSRKQNASFYQCAVERRQDGHQLGFSHRHRKSPTCAFIHGP